jgi:superfamily II DNA or RNA helicase
MNSIQRGSSYENQIFCSLLKKYPDHEVYMWSTVPIAYLQELKFIDSTTAEKYAEFKSGIQDIGCDILMKHDSQYTLVQCKNYSDKNICCADLAGFFCLMATRDQVNGIVISNTPLSKIVSNQINVSGRITYQQVDWDVIQPVIIPNIPMTTTPQPSTIKIEPREYQIDAYNALKDKKRAILQLPCGMGKTNVAIMLAEHYDNIVIFSHLLSYADQLLRTFETALPEYNSVLVNSEGDRDVSIIVLKNKNIFSATYKSADIVHKLLKKLKKVFIITDEFHNLSANNILNKDDWLNQIFVQSHNYLFMSATPKIYEVENQDLNEKIFGKIEYSYKFCDAIDNQYINDYQIIVPNNVEDYNKYEFVYHNMMYYGYKKCIVYCQTKDEADIMIKKLVSLNSEQYKIDLIVDTTKKSARVKILSDFASSQILSIIVSVHILDECIDIPTCDSVYLSYKSLSKIRTIQRISRCMRIHENKRLKSGIMMYCRNVQEINKFFKEMTDNKIRLKIETKDRINNIKILREIGLKESCEEASNQLQNYDFTQQLAGGYNSKLFDCKEDFMLMLIESYKKFANMDLPKPDIEIIELEKENDIYFKFLNDCTEPSSSHISNVTLYTKFESWFKEFYPKEVLPNNREFVNRIRQYKTIEKGVKINKRSTPGVKNLKLKT